MATQPLQIDRFAGLNLIQDPTEVGAEGATAMSNADLARIGRVRTRPGYRVIGSANTTDLGPMAYYKSTNNDYVVAVTNAATTTTQFEPTVGTVISTVAAVPTSNNGFAQFGFSDGTTVLFMGDSTTSIRMLNGNTWSSTAIGYAAIYLAVTANDNRLAVAGPNSTVSFSDPGAPTTFGVNNFLQLQPGTGELTALVTWRDYTVAFKADRFFVFYGNSVDSDGEPIFNYRAVVAGHGCATAGAAVAGEEGVYFADATGIYVTDGDTPRYISRAIEPWLQAGTYSGLPSISLKNQLALVYYERRLYVTDTTNQTTLVYDPATQAWMVWSLTATGMTCIPKASSTAAALFFGEAASNKLALTKLDTETTDGGTLDSNGSAISWSWTSGAYDPSGSNRVSVTLESALSGTGTVTLKVANDLGSFDTGSALTLGTSPAFLQSWQQIDREGTYWQHQLSGSGQAVVNKVVHMISFVKPPGVQ